MKLRVPGQEKGLTQGAVQRRRMAATGIDTEKVTAEERASERVAVIYLS